MESDAAGLGREAGAWIVKYRWWIIAAALVATAFAASGARRLTFNNDLRVFFSASNPQLRALEALENTYGKFENVFIVVAPRDGKIFSRRALAAITELTEAAWQTPYSTRVDSLTNFQYTQAEGDELIVAPLVADPGRLSARDRARIERIALADPLLVDRLISRRGDVAGIDISVRLPHRSIDEVPELAAFARGLARRFRQRYPDIDLYLTGMLMIDASFGEVGRDDLVTLVPAMFLTLIVVIGAALRSFAGTLASFVTIIMPALAAMGLAGWLGMSINPASANAPLIILTLAVADSVHILTTIFEQMRSGRPKHEAIAESLRINLKAVFLTSATTAIGFLSMNFSDAPPFRDLGNIVATGVLAAFVYSVILLPALMAVLPVRTPRPRAAGRGRLDRLAAFVVTRHRFLLWGVSLVVLAFVAAIPRNELNDDFIANFDERFEIRRATDFMERHLTGTDVIEYSLDSGEPGGIAAPAYLARLAAFASWYRTQAKVVHVNSIVPVMKRLNRNMHGDDPAYDRLPRARDLAAQYLLLYEMSLPYGLDLNNQINVDKSATRMIVTLRDMTTRDLREMDDRAHAWLAAHVPTTMVTRGTGLSLVWAHISGRTIVNMLSASFGALVLISVILIFALRSVRIGLVSLLPNLGPAVVAFGLWGVLAGQIGLGLSVVVSLTLGIVVDDTIHFLSHYLRARREHRLAPADAVHHAFGAVGTAMLVTTVALVAGFSLLLFSGYKMNSDLGSMTAMTIMIALVLDFLYLPALLLTIDSANAVRPG